MLTPWEIDLRIEKQERAARDAGLTPRHSAAAAGLEAGDGEDDDEAEEVRRRVQHQAEPYPPDAPEVVHADLDKAYRQAFDAPTGYPGMARVSPEAFRRGPIAAGEAAYGIDYDVSARPVPVPSGTLGAAAIGRPLITGGQSAPSAGTC